MRLTGAQRARIAHELSARVADMDRPVVTRTLEIAAGNAWIACVTYLCCCCRSAAG